MWIQRSALQIVDPIVAWIFTVHGSITRCSAVLILKLLNIGVGLQYGAWIYHLTGTGSTALANPSPRLPTRWQPISFIIITRLQMLFCYRRPVDMISFQIGIIQMRWVFVHSGCPYICAWACCVKCVWSELGLNMYNTFKTLSMQWWTSRAMRSGILRSRSLLAHLNMHLNYSTTCAPPPWPPMQRPTPPPHTPLLVHPNFAATYATSIQVLRNPQVVHKHVSWGILCTFIAATHEATTPPT